MVNFLGDKKFLVGDNETFVDFYFFEMLNFLVEIDSDLTKTYPNLAGYMERMTNLPGIKDQLAKEKTMTFNNKIAKVNC